MTANLKDILEIEVPVIVRIAERQMNVKEVLSLTTGSIIELTKRADEELDLLVNQKPIGSGVAVKIGENFGIRVNFVGDLATRIQASAGKAPEADSDQTSEEDAEALAAAMLAGQI